MVLQDRDIEALKLLSDYFMLSSRQLREWVYSNDSTGRVTRRRLLEMRVGGLIEKRNLQVVNPRDGSTSPVFHLTKQGLEFLAGHLDDDSIVRKPTEPSQPQHLLHYVAVADTQRMLRQAIAATPEPISLNRWVNEDEAINIHEANTPRRFLRTKFSNVLCMPDAAFLLEYNGAKAVFYVEQDRDSFFHERVAARKSPGYRKLWDQAGHRQHFPMSNLDYFFVLFIAPSEKRRDQLRRAFAKKNDEHGVAKAFRFVAFDQVTPNNFLFESLLTRCQDDDLVPMVKRVTPPTTNSQPASLLSSGTE